MDGNTKLREEMWDIKEVLKKIENSIYVLDAQQQKIVIGGGLPLVSRDWGFLVGTRRTSEWTAVPNII